jgi:hypothetical protein
MKIKVKMLKIYNYYFKMIEYILIIVIIVI